MISKRVFIEAANDNYARLATYIADAGPDSEKCLMNWCEGMLGGKDYAEGVAEAVDVQARYPRRFKDLSPGYQLPGRRRDQAHAGGFQGH
ncbi:MAG: hypothetical protein DESF_01838 [Desulfovibrio sp.]